MNGRIHRFARRAAEGRPAIRKCVSKLPKAERLRGGKLFERLFQEGFRGAAGKMAARALPNGGGKSRFAAIAGKSLGGAVIRNRLRRRIRAACRLRKDSFPPGWDLALIARPGMLEAKWEDVTRDAVLAAERAAREAGGPDRRSRRR
jgi:ribonuclease P protein component